MPDAVFLALFSILVVFFTNPLFATLGFEYSTLSALALSLVCGVVAVASSGEPAASLRSGLVSTAVTGGVMASVPLAISILSLPFQPNCAFPDGLAFYSEIALISAIFGGWFALAIRRIVPRRGWAIFAFIAFWFATLFLSLLPGYVNSQLFAYGWQYGFFPGLVWDPAIVLRGAYWISRAEQVVWIALLFSIGSVRWKLLGSRSVWPQLRVPIYSLAGLAAVAIALFILQDTLGITASHGRIESMLSERIHPTPECTIHFAPNSLSEDEQEHLRMDVRWYLFDIERRFALPANRAHINIYIYPSDKSMLKFVGTRIASISKPWLSEVDISKGHLGSLKHELTHVLLRRIGVFPFYASWSTGLTEGAAMSVEPVYDGIYTLDEHAARILELHYASGVEQVMSFSGFAANASEKSYVLAGSFARYLLSAYGPKPFDRVYASLDWKREYGKPLDSLQAEWERWLSPLETPMSRGDSTHFHYYYARRAILFHPCLRRIGMLERSAAHAFYEHDFGRATNLYRSALEAHGGIEALAGLSDALLRQQKLSAAIQLLDTIRPKEIQNQIVALEERRADLRTISGDSIVADSLYRRALSEKLSGSEFLRAYAHRVLLHSAVRAEWLEFLKLEYMPDSARISNDSASIFEAFLHVWMHHHRQEGFDTTDLVLRYLYAMLLEEKGELAGAAHSDPFGVPNGPLESMDSAKLSENDSLALALMALHYAGIENEVERVRYDIEGALRLVPRKYGRAVQELSQELRAEAAFTTGEPRGPETSP